MRPGQPSMPQVPSVRFAAGLQRTRHGTAPLIGAALVALPAAGDPDTGAATWEVRTQGVTRSLTQLLPDRVRAFYVNRGFDSDAAAVFASGCSASPAP